MGCYLIFRINASYPFLESCICGLASRQNGSLSSRYRCRVGKSESTYDALLTVKWTRELKDPQATHCILVILAYKKTHTYYTYFLNHSYVYLGIVSNLPVAGYAFTNRLDFKI